MKMLNRILPTLLIENDKLVKTRRFKSPKYIGDPVNAVKIFNEKEVDEIILLDIGIGKKRKEPNYRKIEEICSEAFMPFAYGGGIRNIEQVKTLFNLGIEKVILNTAVYELPDLVRQIIEIYGSQSVVASVDVRKGMFSGYKAYVRSGKKKVRNLVLEKLC